MVDDLSQKELEEIQDFNNQRDFNPNSLQDGYWNMYNDLMDKRFKGE